MVLSVVKADREAWEIAPEGLTANRLGYPCVDADGVVVVSGLPAGVPLSVQVHVIHQLGQTEREIDHGPMFLLLVRPKLTLK